MPRSQVGEEEISIARQETRLLVLVSCASQIVPEGFAYLLNHERSYARANQQFYLVTAKIRNATSCRASWAGTNTLKLRGDTRTVPLFLCSSLATRHLVVNPFATASRVQGNSHCFAKRRSQHDAQGCVRKSMIVVEHNINVMSLVLASDGFEAQQEELLISLIL